MIPTANGSSGRSAPTGSAPRWRKFGEPGPRYVAYIDPGPPDKRVILQLNHQLDVIHDTSPEGMFTLAKQAPTTSHGWFKDFPYAHPDPTLVAVILNHQQSMFQKRDVRWALALLIDMKAVAMASYRGAATISAIGVPPTGLYPDYYYQADGSLAEGLRDRHRQAQDQALRPDRRQADRRPAASLDGRPDPHRPRQDRRLRSAGAGGRPIRRRRTELLQRAGFTKRGDRWYTDEGKPFTIHIMVEGDLRPVMTRAGSMIAQEWRQFGIDATTVVAQGTMNDRRGAGDFEAMIAWSVETWGGHPDLSFFLDSWHSQFVAKPGKVQTPRNWQRWSNPELDKIIETTRTVGFDDPKGIELGLDYLKLVAREMPTIPLMAYNVFTVMDETYWTGYPGRRSPRPIPIRCRTGPTPAT